MFKSVKKWKNKVQISMTEVEKNKNQTLKKAEEELKQNLEEEIRKLEKIPWFSPHPELLTYKRRALLELLKSTESAMKFVMYFLRKVGEHFGFFVEFELGRLIDRDGKPVIYIKLHGFRDFSELAPELVSEILIPNKGSSTEDGAGKDIFEDVEKEYVKEKINRNKNKPVNGGSSASS